MKWRIGVLCFITTILATLSIGVIQELGNAIQYPAEYAVSLQNYQGSFTKEEVFQKIEQLSTKNDFLLFKPIFKTDGSKETYTFGEQSKNKTLLTDSQMTGMYYANETLDKKVEDEFTKMGFSNVKGGKLPWYMTPVILFLGDHLRTAAVWGLFFVFAILLFAVKMMYLKKAMIRRSLGMFQSTMRKELAVDFGILVATSATILLLFMSWQHSMTNIFVKSFTLTIGVIILCLFIITSITNALFALNVRLMPAINVLKNKKSQSIVSSIWLIGMFASVVIFGMCTNEVALTSQKLSKEINVLKKWENLSEFATITWFETMHGKTINHEIPREVMEDSANRNLKFLQSFPKEDWIYVKKSMLEPRDIDGHPEFSERLAKENVDLAIAKKILYVNEGAIVKNKQLYPKNHYGNFRNQKAPAILYVPEKYRGSIDSIKNLVHFERFLYSTVDANQLPVVMIPNQQKTFLFRHQTVENGMVDTQTEKDKILVQLNATEFPDYTSKLQCDGIVSDSLFYQKKISKNIQQTKLNERFSYFSNASQNIRAAKNEVMTRLFGGIITLLSLTIAQLFVLYQYIKLRIENRSKQMTILSVLGKPITLEISKLLAFLVAGILISSFIAYSLTKNPWVILVILIMYLLEIFSLSIFAWQVMKQKRVQIMKGDFEIL